MADDFIQQMAEERRAQRLRAVMRRCGAAAAIAAVAAAIGGGVWGWTLHQRHEAQRLASARYFQAMHDLSPQNGTPEPGGKDKAQAVLTDLVANGPEGVRAYAALRLADLKMQERDTAAAVRLWNEVSGDAKADSALRDMARYMALNAQADEAPAAELRAGYEALAQGKTPWAPLAREGLVALDLRPGATEEQKQEARRLLTQLSSEPDATEGMRERARQLVQSFGDAG